MKHKSTSYEMNMTEGPLAPKILAFTIPVILSGVLQLAFNTADLIVVGKCCGDQSLAAIGSTGSLINLLVNTLIGLAVGTNVLSAKFYGAKKHTELSQTVHTSILCSIICGLVLAFVGFFASKEILQMMKTPDDVLPLSIKYVRIYFLGMPAVFVYNFGSGILRGVGDTKRPMYYLMISGVLNVLLNLFFVLCLGMDVEGVAFATIISQYLSGFLVLRCLINSEGVYKLEIKELKIHKEMLRKIVLIGLPAGLQGSFFSLSNVIIQSSINSFGSTVMTGNAASSSLEGFIYVIMNSFHQGAVNFVSQNYGGGKIARIKQSVIYCIAFVTMASLLAGGLFYIFRVPLLSLYTDSQASLAYGIKRLSMFCLTYFTCGIMDVMCGCLRGIGKSISPMIISLCGACLFRIIWIFTIFKAFHTLDVLYISYPISWVLTGAVHGLCFVIAFRKIKKEGLQQQIGQS